MRAVAARRKMASRSDVGHQAATRSQSPDRSPNRVFALRRYHARIRTALSARSRSVAASAPWQGGLPWAAALIAAAAVVAVCAPRSRPLNLVVITLDTFRADRIGAYGSARGLTPAIDELAREGVVFETASSAAPLTLPAHTSLFTGLFPPRHGVRENAGVLPDRRRATCTLASVPRHGQGSRPAPSLPRVCSTIRAVSRTGSHGTTTSSPYRDELGRLRARRSADQVVTRATALDRQRRPLALLRRGSTSTTLMPRARRRHGTSALTRFRMTPRWPSWMSR